MQVGHKHMRDAFYRSDLADSLFNRAASQVKDSPHLSIEFVTAASFNQDMVARRVCEQKTILADGDTALAVGGHRF